MKEQQQEEEEEQQKRAIGEGKELKKKLGSGEVGRKKEEENGNREESVDIMG